MELIGSRLPYGTDLGSFGPFSAFADIGNWYLLARLTHGLPKEGLNKSCRRTPRKLQSLENGHTEARW